jgi:hypothetical protein
MSAAASNAVEITDPRVAEFLGLWHENGREFFERAYKSLNYDTPAYRKTAKDRGRKYIALDEGTSGAFLLEKATGNVYRIKAYGVKGRFVDTLDGLTATYREANEHNRACGLRWA